MQISVSSARQLADAVAVLDAADGGTILLDPIAAGYEITLKSVGSSDHDITIRSADPDDPARITRIDILRSENITISDVLVDSRDVYLTRRSYLEDLAVYSSKNVIIENSTFVSAADGYVDGSGTGYTLGESLGDAGYNTGFTFRNNLVTNYAQGLFLEESNGTTISGNIFTRLQFDSIRMVGVQDTLIEDNAFHDFFGSIYEINHDDMIQVWSVNAVQLTQDLTIRGNYFNSGGGAASQTIFVNYENFSARGEYYRNVRIEDNTIYNAHQHGITVNFTDGVHIANNTVLYNPQSVILRADRPEGVTSPPVIWLSAVLNATVENNITSGMNLDGTVSSSNNFIVNTIPQSEAYIASNFVNALSGGRTDLRDLHIIAGSAADLSGAGCAATRPGGVADAVTAVLTSSAARTDSTIITLDAGRSLDENGPLDPAGTTYRWSFPDGTVLEGQSVTYDFDAIGPQPVALTVTTADGRSDTIIRDVAVRDPLLFSMDFENGIADESSYRTYTHLKGDPFATRIAVGADGGQALYIGGADKLVVSRYESHIHRLDSFTLSLSVSLDSPAASGTIVEKGDSFWLLRKDNGSIATWLRTEYGTFEVESLGPVMQDTDWYDLDVTYDGVALALYLDGHLLGSTLVSGVAIYGHRDMTFGATFAPALPYAVDDIVLRDTAASAPEIATARGADIDTGITPPIADDGAMDFLGLLIDEIVYAVQDNAVYDGWTRQDFGTYTLSDDGTAITVTDNGWKAAATSLTIAADTVLSLDFASAVEGEIHGIGFLRNGRLDPNYIFQLDGTARYGIQDYNGFYTTGSGWQSYDIAVGQYFTGDFDVMYFAADDDARGNGVSSFANIDITTAPEDDGGTVAPPVGLLIDGVVYAVQDNAVYNNMRQDFGTYTLSDDGTAITVTDNGWKAAATSLTIAADTVLSLDFASAVEGEIHGIGFLRNGRLDPNYIFQLDGTARYGIQDYNGFYTTGSGWQSYDIAVGQYFTGDFDVMYFAADDDARGNGVSSFANIDITTAPEDDGGTVAPPVGLLIDGVDYAVRDNAVYDGWTRQDFGTYTLSDDGTAITVTDNGWKAAATSLTIAADTVLSLDFASAIEGEIHGIGFLRNGRLDPNYIFQLDGTARYGIQDYNGFYTTGSGWQGYDIAVGQYFTGDFDVMYFAADDDARSDGVSSFANIDIA